MRRITGLIVAVSLAIVLALHWSSGGTALSTLSQQVQDTVNAGTSRIDPTPWLWSYVPGLTADKAEAATDIWAWLAEQNQRQKSKDARRPSWGALSQQGAKASIRTNLRDDKKYLITFLKDGWNNQIIAVVNHLDIAFRSGRIPIVYPFNTQHDHMKHADEELPLSEVFDLDVLIAAKGGDWPVVDFHEVKLVEHLSERHRSVVYDGEHSDAASAGHNLTTGDRIAGEEPAKEPIGCWSGWQAFHKEGTFLIDLGHMDLETVPLPPSFHFNADVERCSIPKIAEMLKSPMSTELPEGTVERMDEISLAKPVHLPEDHLACVDWVYWALDDGSDMDLHSEWRAALGPWRNIGQHLRFQPGLVQLADDLLRDQMKLRRNEKIPPYLAIHMRKTDFPDYLKQTPFDSWAYQTELLMAEMKARTGITIERVVLTTDEIDEELLVNVAALNWVLLDHSAIRTEEQLGGCAYYGRFPTLLDSIIHSRAKAFLGTAASSMSIISGLRVKHWNQGMIKTADPMFKVPAGWRWGKMMQEVMADDGDDEDDD